MIQIKHILLIVFIVIEIGGLITFLTKEMDVLSFIFLSATCTFGSIGALLMMMNQEKAKQH
jgi:uncharacterized membrane protein